MSYLKKLEQPKTREQPVDVFFDLKTYQLKQ